MQHTFIAYYKYLNNCGNIFFHLLNVNSWPLCFQYEEQRHFLIKIIDLMLKFSQHSQIRYFISH